MTTNINLELKLDGVRGPYEFLKEDGTVSTMYDVNTLITSTGDYIGAGVAITETSIKVISISGTQSTVPLSIEALLARQFLETLLKDAGKSVKFNLDRLWSEGKVAVTEEESYLIKTLLREKRDSLAKKD